MLLDPAGFQWVLPDPSADVPASMLCLIAGSFPGQGNCHRVCTQFVSQLAKCKQFADLSIQDISRMISRAREKCRKCPPILQVNWQYAANFQTISRTFTGWFPQPGQMAGTFHKFCELIGNVQATSRNVQDNSKIIFRVRVHTICALIGHLQKMSSTFPRCFLGPWHIARNSHPV